MSALPDSVERWRGRGRFVHARGHEVFVVDEGMGPCVLVLHGFPTSGYDFSAVMSEMTRSHRAIIADMPGFGLSAKPAAYGYALSDQADVLLDVWAQLGARSGHLLAHDMGTSIACELLARREQNLCPITIDSVAFSNGSVFIEMAKLTPSQKLLRRPVLGPLFAGLGSAAVFRAQLRRIFAHGDAVPTSELDAMWALLCHRDGRKRLPAIIRYVDERYAKAGRWLPPLGRLDIPALVLWGERDPVSVVEIAERLCREIPRAQLVRLVDVGHYPMVEDPARFAAALLAFWARVTSSREARLS
jgi:pimeloyl-ACP methyl ester carboxylesterase